MQAGLERPVISATAPSRASGPSRASWCPPGLPRRTALRLRRLPRLAAGPAPAPDAIDRAIARVRAGLPGALAAAERAAVEAGAAHLLSLPRRIALRRIAERIYDPHGFALRPPEPRPATEMLDDLRVRLAASEPPLPAEASVDLVWHERRSRRLAWLECRRALIAIIHDESGEDGDEPERRRQAALATERESF